MGISERFQCYVFGQCEVGFDLHKFGVLTWFEYLFFLPSRSTRSILKLQTVPSPVTSSVAKMMTVSGGLG